MGASLRFQIEFCGWTPSKGTGVAAHNASKNPGISIEKSFPGTVLGRFWDSFRLETVYFFQKIVARIKLTNRKSITYSI
jgi:hypothetical protein